VTILSPCLREVLARVEGIEVRRGRPLEDPRLERIDLRGRIHRIKLDLRRPDGRPLSHVFVAKGPDFRKFRFLRPARNPLHTTGPLVDLEIRAPGLKRRRYHGISDGETIYLRQAIPFRLALAFAWPQDFDPGRFRGYSRMRLVRAENFRDRIHQGQVDTEYFSRRGRKAKVEDLLHLSFPGTYEFTLELIIQGKKGRIRRKVPSLTRRIVVRESPETPQGVELELDAERIGKLWRPPAPGE
jgi:hypothetical protein